MRCTQEMGLPGEAVSFLANNAVKMDQCPTCQRHSGYSTNKITNGEWGMFDEYCLLRYDLIGGRTADEFVQTEIWSSGPMVWLGLKVSDGTVFEHPDADILETSLGRILAKLNTAIST